ncbi:MAG: four helix bundle protein [Candidatus Hydrogenedentes bacterium]|nr:four helix bundle protein [Candidatus Hydrogenedentota bacterium]
MTPQFDHEKLDVYKASLEFVRFVNELEKSIPPAHRNARDQLIRASQSIPLNIAEGNGKRFAAERRRFLEIARGSAMECAAILDVLVTVSACDRSQIAPGKDFLLRIVAMLSKMTEPRESVAREDGESYGEDSSIEYDDEQEHEHV